MCVNICTLKINGKDNLLTFSARGQKQNATKPLTKTHIAHMKLLAMFQNQF